MVEKSPRSSGPASDYSQRMWRLSAMGFTLASEVAAGALLGWLVDYLFKTDPVGVIVGCLAGMAVGMTTFIRTALEATKSDRQEREQRPRSGPLPDGSARVDRAAREHHARRESDGVTPEDDDAPGG
jgi:F0F1-type ATP synthase assembly protein I